MSAILLTGGLAAAAVGFATAQNPHAAPHHYAALARVLIILTLTSAAAYAQTSRLHTRMSGVLLAFAVFSSFWLLNGSSVALLFSIGVLCSGLAQVLSTYVLLAHPVGRLQHGLERRLLAIAGGVAATMWIIAVEVSGQPALKTPFLACTPHCQQNVFALGAVDSMRAAFGNITGLAWIVMVCAIPVLLARRSRSASAPLRCALTPVVLAATLSAGLLLAYRAALAGGSGAAESLGAAYVASVVASPVAILVGLAQQRMFLGQAIAGLVRELAGRPDADPQVLLSRALGDPLVTIAYQRPGERSYVDVAGQPIAPVPTERAVTRIERAGRVIAAVTFSPDLAGQESFVQAAASAALLRLERARLEADLVASMRELEASRGRLVDSAQAERRRLERDLHDGVQQHLVGLRIKLGLAAEAFDKDPGEGKRAVAAVEREMDDVLDEVRSLARGIYPSLLHAYGVGEALKSAARLSPIRVVVRSAGLARYRDEAEIAVYFCCLEALQNVAKHGGPDAEAVVTLRSDRPHRLYFEVRDSGVGFDPDTGARGNGLVNMRDRVEAVGGTVCVSSVPGAGTVVRGYVPDREPAAAIS